jgi:hypothetical protein
MKPFSYVLIFSLSFGMTGCENLPESGEDAPRSAIFCDFYEHCPEENNPVEDVFDDDLFEDEACDLDDDC